MEKKTDVDDLRSARMKKKKADYDPRLARMEKNNVYVCTLKIERRSITLEKERRVPYFHWHVLHNSKQGELLLTENRSMFKKDFPCHFGCAAIGSKIYAIGGQYLSDLSDSDREPAINEVLIFDTLKPIQGWCGGNPMKQARYRPKVVSVPKLRKVYVFGGNFFTYAKFAFDCKTWAECYDVDKGKWDTVVFGCKVPARMGELVTTDIGSTVIDCGTLFGILFWDEQNFYFLNFSDLSWVTGPCFDPPSTLKDVVVSPNVTIVNNMLYSFHGGFQILGTPLDWERKTGNGHQAMKAEEKHVPNENIGGAIEAKKGIQAMEEINPVLPVYTFGRWDGPPLILSEVGDMNQNPYLVATGRALCLLWFDAIHQMLHYTKFWIQPDGQKLNLNQSGRDSLSADGIYHCFPLAMQNDGLRVNNRDLQSVARDPSSIKRFLDYLSETMFKEATKGHLQAVRAKMKFNTELRDFVKKYLKAFQDEEKFDTGTPSCVKGGKKSMEELLDFMELKKYEKTFQDELIVMDYLQYMEDEDFKRLNIPLEVRRSLLVVVDELKAKSVPDT